MNKSKDQKTKASQKELGPLVVGALLASLVIISLFPLYVTFALEEWPLQPSVIVLDIIYLFILAGYLYVLTGRNRSKWLVNTITTVSVIGVTAIVWLLLSLASFSMSP